MASYELTAIVVLSVCRRLLLMFAGGAAAAVAGVAAPPPRVGPSHATGAPPLGVVLARIILFLERINCGVVT